MLIPMLELATPDGAPFPWRSIWQRRNVLLIFLHDGCARCEEALAQLGERVGELDEEETTAVAVAREPRRVPAGVVALVDPDDRLRQALGLSPGELLAADRFFEVVRRSSIHELGSEAALDDVLGSIDLSERSCPECGVPTW